jgi:mRNA guanylyltransferase
MPDDYRRCHTSTLLDGELVLDIDGPNRILRFLLFDCIVIGGKNLMGRTFDKRLGYLREFILKPYAALRRRDRAFDQRQPFTMELKKLELSYWMTRVLDEAPLLKHGSDGLLFTARDAPYVAGKCDKMYAFPSKTYPLKDKVETRRGKHGGLSSGCPWNGG